MRKIKNPVLAVVFVFWVVLSAFLGFSLSYRNLILPKVFVSGIEVSGLTVEVAEAKLKKVFEGNPNKIKVVRENGLEVENLSFFETKVDYRWASDQAIKVGRTGNPISDIRTRIKLLYSPVYLTAPVVFVESNLDDLVEEVAFKVQVEPKWPKILRKDNLYVLDKGKNGLVLDKARTKNLIWEKLSYPGDQTVAIPLSVVNTEEKKELVEKTINILNSWGDLPLQIKYGEYIKNISGDELAGLYNLTYEGLNAENFLSLSNEVAGKIETEAKDAVFEFENGRVKEFKPEIVGVVLDRPRFESLLKETLSLGKEKEIKVPVILSYPKVRTGDINNLGIKELIGVGKSSFSHSIPGRVFNVNLAASRINGVVVAPGEEFSFNKAVGEINRQTGYQTAYVISEGKTVLGDGGGVCQVSTTTFRAAMNSGLPIIERRAHAYRVGYYEQDSPPGLDATIYSPSTDFKFLNDTGHHILIQTKVDTKKLTMQVEIYGTSDGRVASISKPVVSSQSSAPPASYVDDPNLPKGTTKRIDFAAAGAKVSFDYKVERGGEILFEKKFISSYQPWRAVYLVGTGN